MFLSSLHKQQCEDFGFSTQTFSYVQQSTQVHFCPSADCPHASAPAVSVNKTHTPHFCHGGQGEGDTQPSRWLKVSWARHSHPEPRLKSTAVRPGPQRLMPVSTCEPPGRIFFPLSVLCLSTRSAVCKKCFNMQF